MPLYDAIIVAWRKKRLGYITPEGLPKPPGKGGESVL